MTMSKRLETRRVPYLAVFAAILLVSSPAIAQSPATKVLFSQAKYWSDKGRPDLSAQAYRRILALEPANVMAKTALASMSGSSPKKTETIPAAFVAGSASEPNAKTLTAIRSVKPNTTRAVVSSANRGGKPDVSGAARAAGFDALNQNDLQKAEAAFNRALSINASDSDAAGGLGIIRLRAGRFADARDLLKRAVANKSDGKWTDALNAANFYASLETAKVAQTEGRLADAETLLRSLIAQGDDSSYQAGTLLGTVLSLEGRFSEAADLYQDLSQKSPQTKTFHALAVSARARDASEHGNATAAEGLFQAAIAENIDDPWLHFEYARFLLAQGRSGPAISIMAPFQTGKSDDGRFASALILSQVGKLDEAEAAMARVEAPNQTPPMQALITDIKTRKAVQSALNLSEAGRPDEALQDLQALSQTQNLPVSTLATLGLALDDLGDSQRAKDLVSRALNMPRTDPEAYKGIITLLARDQNWEMANLLLKDLAKNRPESGTGLNGLSTTLSVAHADALRQTGAYAEAFELLRKSWSAAPNDPDVLGALARLYLSGKMPDKAVKIYRLVLRSHPDDLATLQGLADSAIASGDYPTARDSLSHALALSPANPDLYLAAARIETAAGHKRAALSYLQKGQALTEARLGRGEMVPSENPFVTAGTAGPIDPFRLDDSPQAAGIGRVDLEAGKAVATPNPARARFESEIKNLNEDTGASISADTYYRTRSGEQGLSKLNEVGGNIKAQTDLGPARLDLSLNPVAIDSGRPEGSALARFGLNGLSEATGIVDQAVSKLSPSATQHSTGIGVSTGLSVGPFEARIGTTPLGLGKTKVVGSVKWSGRVAKNTTLSVFAEHKPVTDSVLSYAGTHDPVTGYYWGGVIRQGGGASLSYYTDSFGLYADMASYNYKGTATQKNSSFEGNMGGSAQVHSTKANTLSVGVNVNIQAYKNNQNNFSFGQGGYFSPQSFTSISFPIHYTGRFGRWSLKADVSPGLQSYQNDQTDLFPSVAWIQAKLDALKSANSDVRSYYDSQSRTGFGVAGVASVTYKLSDQTRIIGDVEVNTFGNYNETVSKITVKQQLGNSQ